MLLFFFFKLLAFVIKNLIITYDWMGSLCITYYSAFLKFYLPFESTSNKPSTAQHSTLFIYIFVLFSVVVLNGSPRTTDFSAFEPFANSTSILYSSSSPAAVSNRIPTGKKKKLPTYIFISLLNSVKRISFNEFTICKRRQKLKM